MEDYVCASEDRWHYNTEDYGVGRYGMETPMIALPPFITKYMIETEDTEEEETH